MIYRAVKILILSVGLSLIRDSIASSSESEQSTSRLLPVHQDKPFFPAIMGVVLWSGQIVVYFVDTIGQ